MQGFIDSVDSNVIKPWPPEQYWSPIRGSKFEIETIIVKMFKTSYIKNNNAIVCDITMLASSDSVDYKLLKQWPVKILSRLLLKNNKATICYIIMIPFINRVDCIFYKPCPPPPE